MPEAERRKVRKQLERYCGQDTEGMIWNVEALERLCRAYGRRRPQTHRESWRAALSDVLMLKNQHEMAVDWPPSHAPVMNTHAQVTKVRVKALTANLVGTLLTILLCIAFIALARLLPNYSSTESTWKFVALLAALISLLFVHELLHGIALVWWAKVPRRHVRFGVMWRALAPYCHCNVMITVHDYRRTALLPLWITGGVALALMFIFPADWLGLVTGVALAACVGDVWMVIKLRRFPADWLVQDSPSEIGCDVHRPANPSPYQLQTWAKDAHEIASPLQ